jgi:GT2 family glycosyltransferase
MLPCDEMSGENPEEHEPTVGVVIVTHNSASTIGRCLADLFAGELAPDQVIIVDSGSSDATYLDDVARADPRVEVIRRASNVGFCVGNNIGVAGLGHHRYVLFLNPDAFVSNGFIRSAVDLCERDPRLGALGPKLMGADPVTFASTGRIDSTGVFQTGYGRWFDRGRGEFDVGTYDHGEASVPALCGAALFCRSAALADVAPAGAVFDERFFMYKEDIDLSLRISRAGWRIVVDQSLVVLHVRGWTADRRGMPFWARRRSLANEWRIWRKGLALPAGRLRTFGYLTAKSVMVALGR